MKLKVKFLKLLAGRPVAILHKNFAANVSIHVDDRVNITKDSKKIIAVVDLASGLLREGEIAVSQEVSNALKLKENDMVDVRIAVNPESLSLIKKKLDNHALTKDELQEIMSDIVANALTESEIAYFISAIYKSGMSIQETVNLIKAIVTTGKKLGIKGEIADKHSIGGIPGRTTPIVVSICASAGLIIPKTSSRAITSPAGTADALEVLCKVDFSINEIKKIVGKVGACMVWGGSLGLAPADDKIIQVERLLNLDPEAQLLASILAKKIAVNAKYVLIDIPYGKNAKVTKNEALNLESKFKEIAKYFNIKLTCSLKEINEPLGNGIGPALEITDVIKVLKREDSCYKLEQRSLELASSLLELTGKAKKGQGFKLAKKILNSGKALSKFQAIIKAQKGKLNGIKKAKFSHDIKADKNFKINDINIKKINNLARIAGCPLDKYAGIYLHKHCNQFVKKGEKFLTIYSESKDELEEAVKYYHKEKPIC